MEIPNSLLIFTIHQIINTMSKKDQIFQVIATFNGFDQEFMNFPTSEIDLDELFESPHAMESFIKQNLTNDEIVQLRKLSCCLCGHPEFDCPEWYMNANGKFYFHAGGVLNIGA